ncbi:MAG TPA: DUF3105 domain-containing protein [Polyangiaceae bacterium]|nr:DUF3105 domain-containing protein [Polyangiaceae bacterium]
MLARLLPSGGLASVTALLVVSACSGSESGGSGAAGHAGNESGGGSSSTPGGSSEGGTSPVAGAAAGGNTNGGADSSPGGGAGESTAAAGETSLGGAAGGDGNLGAGACKIVVAEQALAAGNHVTLCSDVTYATNPPSSGSHYPVWADFGVYDFALPRGFWVHNLEHGAVVVTYNCPGGCADEVAAATAWLAKLTVDAACPGGTPRALLVPDPKLDVRWAASSWGYTLRSDCFDAEAFGAFYSTHAGMPPAPEIPVCSAGTDFRDPKNDACGANQ